MTFAFQTLQKKTLIVLRRKNNDHLQLYIFIYNSVFILIIIAEPSQSIYSSQGIVYSIVCNTTLPLSTFEHQKLAAEKTAGKILN